MDKDKLIKENEDLEDSQYGVEMEDFFSTTENQYDDFNEYAWNKGEGYKCPNFPIFDENIEGLESGLYMIAGESNGGKTALVQALFLDYALYEPNKLFGIYFSLDDTRNELIPRIIAAHEHIPISVGSKPQRYMNMLEQGLEGSGIYQEWLDKRDNALEWLKSTKECFKIEDSNKITCGEQIIDYLRKVKIYLETHAPDKKMIVAIDSMSDIRFISKNFKSDKERNDYIARTVKEWTVELDIPIFGTLHLRKIEQNRRPNIADVKESGEYAYEASFLGIIYNDVSRNKQAATIYQSDPDTGEKLPIIELDWAKNKKSSFKNRTYHYFWPSFSDVRECSKEVMDRYNSLIYSN